LKLDKDDLVDNKLISTNFSIASYKSPCEFMNYLIHPEVKKQILILLNLSDYPFKIINEYKLSQYEIKNELKDSFHQLFQYNLYLKDYKIILFYPSLTFHNFDIVSFINSLKSQTIPILHFDYLQNIYEFIKINSNWKEFLDYIDIINYKIKDSTLDETNSDTLIYIFKLPNPASPNE
jgi:hypothetical protein